MKKYLLLFCFLGTAGTSAFTQPPYPITPPPGSNMVKAEYFFNTDPGFGNGSPIPLASLQDVNAFTSVLTLNGTALNAGFHRLYVRTLDAAGIWSHASESVFARVLVPPYPDQPNSGGNMIKAEYFIDTDPGVGNGVEIPVPNSADVSGTGALLNIAGLAIGVHRLYLRTLDANGKWSLTHYAVFDNSAVTPYPAAPPPPGPLVGVEYYFDTDPGFGNGLPITVPSSVNVPDFSFNVPVGGLSEGRHTFYLRSRENAWSLSAYAEFLLGSTLPVSWLYLKGEVKDKDAQIQWATGSEENTARFVIENSLNGLDFTPVGEVKSANNASGSTYHFTHKASVSGTNYYRIKQVDKDGKFSYSKVILLLFRQGLTEPVLFPVPASTMLYVVLPAESRYRELKVYTANGVLIKSKRILAVDAGGVISVPVQDLPKGNYVLELSGKNQRTIKQWIKG